jgi:DNA-binding MarR family transcriptional regulator
MERRAARMEDAPLPVLLRAARNTYASAVQAPLANAGFDDIPRNGVFVIGAISRNDAPLAEIIRWLGASKQAAGQLVDTLVLRGYLERSIDDADRRRLRVSLTERGQAVAAITRAAVETVERRLLEKVGKERLAHTRATLMALARLAPPASAESSDRS